MKWHWQGRRVARRAALVTAGVALPLGWLLSAPASGAPSDDSTRTVRVADQAEAWFAAAPVDVCTTPLGCPPQQVPTSPYPPDTLHVGVAGGQETARTYLVPALSTLPFGATATSGTMTLPVATGSTDGTASASSAKVLACLATAPVTDGTAGSTATPPAIDCSISQALVYDATKNVFTLELTPFLTAWVNGKAPDGIALVPSKTTQPTDAWHVTFNGHKRTGSQPISSIITASVTTDSVAPPAVTAVAPAPAAPVAPAPAVPSLPNTTVAPPAAAPPVVASAPPVAQQFQPVALSRPFQYPLVFLLPIALLAGAVFLVRLFTRDFTPARART